MSEQAAENLLKEWIIGQNQCITYRLLSRKLDIHVNLAKRYLDLFYEKNNSLDVAYLLTGIEDVAAEPSSVEKDDEKSNDKAIHELVKNRISVGIYSKDEVEDAKSNLKHVRSMHIYSIAPSRASDFTNLTSADAQVQLEDAQIPIGELYSSCGVIKNNIIPADMLDKKRSSVKVSTMEVSHKPQIPSARQQQSKSEPNPAKIESTKTEPIKPKPKSGGQGALSFGNKPKSKDESKPKDESKLKNEEAKSSIQAAFARAKTPRPPVEKVVVADEPTEDITIEEPEEDEETREKRKKRLEDLERMFDNDDVEMDDPEEPEQPPGSPDWDIDMEETADPVKEVSEPPNELSPTEILSNAPPGRKRGRRKVSKRVTTTDANGYLVTELKDEWESFSEEETEPKAERATPFPSIPSLPDRNDTKGKGKAKKGQANLFSYFKKN